MNESDKSIMGAAFQEFIKTGAEAAIYLKNGIRLTGKILAYDDTAVHMSCTEPWGIVVDRSAMSSVQKNVPGLRQHENNSGGNPRPK